VRLAGHGHAAIRATHHKTLELARDGDITERATCVIGVGLTSSGPVTPVAGDVRITIHCGAESFAFHAWANSSWDPAGTAVIRRSPFRLPDTFATHANAAASDLPRGLVAALSDPQAIVELDVEAVPGRRCVVLYALDPSLVRDPRLTAEVAAADVVVAEDEPAARLLSTRVAQRPVDVPGRVLVVATTELPGTSVVAALADADVETVGLSPALAAAAASPSRAPLVLVPDGADVRAAVRDAPAAARLVVPVSGAGVDKLLAMAAAERGTVSGVLAQPFAPPVRVHPNTPVELPSRDSGYVCLDASIEPAALDPRVRAAIDGLLADGVPTRTVASALAELAGWPRRQAYDYVIRLGAASGAGLR
jgi:hypothetical protein